MADADRPLAREVAAVDVQRRAAGPGAQTLYGIRHKLTYRISLEKAAGLKVINNSSHWLMFFLFTHIFFHTQYILH